MIDQTAREAWDSGSPYERYVGRWSRQVAREFLAWLAVPSGQRWGDVGCGTGALAASILRLARPASVFGIDASQGLLTEAQRRLTSQPVQLARADAGALPWATACCAVTVAGLVLNFVPDAVRMAREMVRVTRPGGKVAAYVWDYSGGMQMMRQFWDAAIEVSPEDAAHDQAERFPLCEPEALMALFHDAGLNSPVARAIEIPTVFKDFDDFWDPFLGKQGAAPAYLASLDREKQARIREVLRARLIPSAGGSIALSARAWAVQAIV